MIGRPLPINRSAEDILNAKRGIGDLINSWNPEAKAAYAGIKKRIYSALDGQLDSLVPESADLNQRISSLIPVRDRARGEALAPGIMQQGWQRFMRPTGALIGGIEGARAGYQAYGVPGAVLGGSVGVFAPAALASPGFRMAIARTMATPEGREALMRGGIGAVMQLVQPQPQQ